MRGKKIAVSAGAILLTGAVLFLLSVQELIAVVSAIFVHELGHVIALHAMGMRVKGLRAEARGFCIEYSGSACTAGHIAAAAAGPIAGFIYAFAAAGLGSKLENETLLLSSGISMLLSAFNMLPVLPLDGGRVFALLCSCVTDGRHAEKAARAVGILTSASLLAFGTYMMWRGHGIALTVAAIWLLMYIPEEEGVVKRKEIL